MKRLRQAWRGLVWVLLISIGRAAEAIPVQEYAVAAPAAEAPLMILLSGDGGWAEIDDQLAQRWQKRGWPVVGGNSLKYFWQARTPQELADDLARAIHVYQTRWGARPIVLAGFSQGADVIAFAYNRLPAEDRPRIAAMVLISPAEDSAWEVHVSGWLGRRLPGPPVAPEVNQTAPLPVLIITGEKDPDAFHEWTERPGLEHQRWPGDHHLDHDYDRLDRTIADFLRRAFGPRADS